MHKWAPGDGYLYDLEISLVRGDTVVDSYHQSVGVRTVQVDGISVLDQPRAVLLHRLRQANHELPAHRSKLR